MHANILFPGAASNDIASRETNTEAPIIARPPARRAKIVRAKVP
jgi:hypothetical protein